MTYGTVFGKIKEAIKREEKHYKGERLRYDLRLSEINALYERTIGNPFDGICSAFDYGFIKGMRYYKKYGNKK